MNHAEGRTEPQFDRAFGHDQRVFGVFDPAADDRIDVDVETGVLREVNQITVNHLQALLRDLVGFDVVDADLQVFESGAVQLFDVFARHVIAVADQPGDHPARANVRNDLVNLWVQHRLAAADGDCGGSE